ncbi:MAG: hypothetical protein HZC05_00980 [Candidatus Magasanikbacteria bacterium]|nr:hypothetical protein [Candidatus Magasanikbacteria bacterium]
MIWSRIFSFLAVVWFLIFWELANYYPAFLLVFGSLAWLLPTVVLAFWFYRVRQQKLPAHHLALAFVFFVVGLSFFLPLVDRPSMRQAIIIFSGFLLYFDLVTLPLFVNHHKNYAVGSLEQINLAMLVWSIFLFSSFFFGWATFLAKSFWPILLAAAGFFFLAFWEMFFLRKIDWKKSYQHSLILSILAMEFFWAIAIWPVGFVTKGLIFSFIVLYLVYLIHGLLSGTYNRRRFATWGAVTGFLIVIVLGMARWI